MARDFFTPIPVVIREGMTDDERLLAAWDGLPTSEIMRTASDRPCGLGHGRLQVPTDATSLAARRRVIALRGGL